MTVLESQAVTPPKLWERGKEFIQARHKLSSNIFEDSISGLSATKAIDSMLDVD